ncbi:acyl-CoA dehydrogenase family protein [Halorarius halobius]|uniref:acyl-CoA dehydrogenase family protein n=1 Tax=Halorarius halobius TaxID=2962671 RepID=UPI0020CC83CE|nr:acyl-CoA dehydrogenase family protein [Halorarius halobius]
MVQLSDEQQMIVDSARQLAESEFADKAFSWEGEFPWENIEVLADHGFLGINYPEEYGGGGMTEFEALLLIETVGRVCPDTAMALVAQHFVSPRAVAMFGSEEAKQRYLEPVIEGDALLSIAMSEPQAGSDVQSMTTTVTEEGGELLLNGEKIWVSLVPEATAAVTWAKFPEGLGMVIMDFDADGVEINQHFTNMENQTQTQFYMDDVVIPPENVLVRESGQFKRMLSSLNWERLGGAAIANAIAINAIDKALDHATTREQFGQPIADFQGIEWKLADMVAEVEMCRAITYQAAMSAIDNDGTPDKIETSIAKFRSAEMVEEVVSESLQIHGANGYQKGHPLEYLHRMARGRRIAGGTPEVQRNSISQGLKRNGYQPRYLQ